MVIFFSFKIVDGSILLNFLGDHTGYQYQKNWVITIDYAYGRLSNNWFVTIGHPARYYPVIIFFNKTKNSIPFSVF
jgi:hypothetical protein